MQLVKCSCDGLKGFSGKNLRNARVRVRVKARNILLYEEGTEQSVGVNIKAIRKGLNQK